MEEQSLRSEIPLLSSVDDKVSQLVRDQYEENPYPRWLRTGIYGEPRTVQQFFQAIKLDLGQDTYQLSDRPEILVAGCGTGVHAISTASKFLNCEVLAVDLSLSSLSYAVRKTKELGVPNIKYMQGDILKLGQLERQFDIVESCGVLHHMDDPVAGWKVLVERLRTGGMMKIALYSEIARQDVVTSRNQIADRNYGSSSEDIRRYRKEIFDMDLDESSEISKLLGTNDFFSLSECRDLIFHVQEHRFTLPQIEEILDDLGLSFIGFEFPQQHILDDFREAYPEKDAMKSLSSWHQFELNNQDTFREMYQFWLQKKQA